jgi:agmatinase
MFNCLDVDRLGVPAIIERLREQVDELPTYLSIDIDVLDPAFAPGTGTPESAGLNSRELMALVRGFAGAHMVGGDVVEVAPPYDHAEITGIAAANLVYEYVSLLDIARSR